MRGITPQERLEKWNEAICAQKASGLTIKDWCEQNGISPNTYYYYLRRIRDCIFISTFAGSFTSSSLIFVQTLDLSSKIDGNWMKTNRPLGFFH